MKVRISLLGLLCLIGVVACDASASGPTTRTPVHTPSATPTMVSQVITTPNAINLAPTNAPTMMPAPSAPTPTPIRTTLKASVSPDGQWLAQGIAEFHGDQVTYRTQMKVMKREGSTGWAMIQEAPIALGYTIPQPLHWSRDGRYVYFTNRPNPDGCSMFINGADLWRINLATGEQQQVMPAQAIWLTLSPDERMIAYIAQGRPKKLVLRDIKTGQERETPLQVENDAFAGRIVWASDGSALALTIAENSCRTYQWTQGILHVNTTILAQTMLIPNDARLLQTLDWREPNKILLRDKDGHQYWLNPTTRTLDATAIPEVPINSAQWPPFHSETLGFTMNFPPEWELTDRQNGVYLWTDESFGSGPEPTRYEVQISEYANPQARSFIEVATAPWNEDVKRAFTFTSKMIGNLQTYETTSIPSRSGVLYVFFEGNKRYLVLALSPYDAQSPWPAQAKFERLFRTLLQTVRLTR